MNHALLMRKGGDFVEKPAEAQVVESSRMLRIADCLALFVFLRAGRNGRRYAGDGVRSLRAFHSMPDVRSGRLVARALRALLAGAEFGVVRRRGDRFDWPCLYGRRVLHLLLLSE